MGQDDYGVTSARKHHPAQDVGESCLQLRQGSGRCKRYDTMVDTDGSDKEDTNSGHIRRQS